MDFNQKVALVTGGAKGIGKAYVIALLERGVKVCIADLDEETGKQTAEELSEKHQGNVTFVKTDVSNRESFEKAVQETLSTYGRLDILINNAGYFSEHNWERAIAVNTVGTIYGINLAFKYMGKDRGHNGGYVINTASVAGIQGGYALPAYSASKFAVVGATKCFGAEFHYKKHGVTVNTVCPGGVDTEMYHSFPDLTLDPDGMREAISSIPPISASVVAGAMIKLLEDGKNGALMRIYEDGIPQYIE